MYRGAVYADTRDYQRCVDLWKYAFALRHHAATRRHPRSLLTHEYLFTLQASHATAGPFGFREL